MNKQLIFMMAICLLIAVGFTSCAKEQNCVCTTTTTNLNNGSTTTEDDETVKITDTKKRAKSTCENLNTTTTFSNEKKETRCEIK